LSFAARETICALVSAMGEAGEFKELLKMILGDRLPIEEKGEGNVFFYREGGNKIVVLKDDTNFTATEKGEVFVGFS
jgi:hypothetical protein